MKRGGFVAKWEDGITLSGRGGWVGHFTYCHLVATAKWTNKSEQIKEIWRNIGQIQ